MINHAGLLLSNVQILALQVDIANVGFDLLRCNLPLFWWQLQNVFDRKVVDYPACNGRLPALMDYEHVMPQPAPHPWLVTLAVFSVFSTSQITSDTCVVVLIL